ncbi:hypothetical protein FRC12_012535 [Ceratobasidium sp. 428]|nr:hypothetical protein FRC12_012535 [Ceratobasidium sp. 428]
MQTTTTEVVHRFKAMSTISSAMVGQSGSAIIAILTKHGCREITDQLDLNKCQHKFPFARGGFGDIYQGTLKGGDKLVAIKCAKVYLEEGDKGGRKALKRVARELYYWSRFEHKNVLGLLGLAQFQDQLAMISPWMDKGTLLQYIKQNPTADRYQLCVDISVGVAYLHQRDAANVLISSEGVAMLTDFGCTELKNGTLCFTATTGDPKFTMRWAAPEILEGLQARSKEGDVYALGMTLIEVITGVVPFSDKGDPAVVKAVVVDKLMPERPKTFPSFTQDEAEQLWGIVVDACAHGASDRPDSRTIQRRLRNIRRRIIQPSANRFVADSVACAIPNGLTDGSGERGGENQMQPPIVKNRFLYPSRFHAAEKTEQREGREREEEYQIKPRLSDAFSMAIAVGPDHSSKVEDKPRDRSEYDDQQRLRAYSAPLPPPRRQMHGASAPRRQSTSIMLANPEWTSPSLAFGQPAPYYIQEVYSAHSRVGPSVQPQTPPLPSPSHRDGYQLPTPQSYQQRPPHPPGPYDPRGQHHSPQPPYGYPATGYPQGIPHTPGPSGVIGDPNTFKLDPYGRHTGIPRSFWPDPGRSDAQVTYTDDAATKPTLYLRRRCFNCRVTEPPGWRKSTFNPGKIVRAG